MERTVPGPVTAPSQPPGAPPAAGRARPRPVPDGTGLLGDLLDGDLLDDDLLDGVPRPREARATAPTATGPRQAALSRLRRVRPRHFLPTPAGTPFTFAYTAVLAVTSLVAALADPALVHTLQQGSSTDVAHLARTPVLVLLASALWIAGGVVSPYAAAFVLVLSALERRIGAARAAGVFLAGHVLATLATEVPVGLAVLAGHLPDSSLHRLDYGISFGVAAAVGALAGLLAPWPRRLLLVPVTGMLLGDLVASRDPMTDWGHLIALAIGVATWPWVRRPRTRA
ncbi:rhomboid-like protein [Streptomyces collinus]|uniref:rhomboid-like protein n=1 Tax=Streptomyces collinus TaxID=42684 RepID=UPI00362A960D